MMMRRGGTSEGKGRLPGPAFSSNAPHSQSGGVDTGLQRFKVESNTSTSHAGSKTRHDYLNLDDEDEPSATD